MSAAGIQGGGELTECEIFPHRMLKFPLNRCGVGVPPTVHSPLQSALTKRAVTELSPEGQRSGREHMSSPPSFHFRRGRHLEK